MTTRSADVIVSTPDGAPVANAVVRADPIDPHHPLNISDYFRDEPGTLGAWRTDQAGRVTIVILSERPTALSFAAAGYTPDSVLINPAHPSPYSVTLQPLFPAASGPGPTDPAPGKPIPQRP